MLWMKASVESCSLMFPKNTGDSGCQECVLIAGCVFRGWTSDGGCQNVGQLCTVVLVRMKVCVVGAHV